MGLPPGEPVDRWGLEVTVDAKPSLPMKPKATVLSITMAHPAATSGTKQTPIGQPAMVHSPAMTLKISMAARTRCGRYGYRNGPPKTLFCSRLIWERSFDQLMVDRSWTDITPGYRPTRSRFWLTNCKTNVTYHSDCRYTVSLREPSSLGPRYDDGSNYAAWLLKTTDDGQTYTWLAVT